MPAISSRRKDVVDNSPLDLSAVAGSTLPRQERQRAVTGSLVLAVLFAVSFEGVN